MCERESVGLSGNLPAHYSLVHVFKRRKQLRCVCATWYSVPFSYRYLVIFLCTIYFMYFKIHIKSQGAYYNRYFNDIQYMYGHFVRNLHTIVNEIIYEYITYASVGHTCSILTPVHSPVLHKTYLLIYTLIVKVFYHKMPYAKK